MATLRIPAIVCATRAHGEHGAIARLLTPTAGLLGAYVPGGRSSRMRPVLIPGNKVAAELRARSETQLASASVELADSIAPLLGEPAAAAAIDWVTSVTAMTLPEGQPYPALYDALSGVLAAIGLAPGASGWAAGVARYELLLLAELGFGLDLESCVVTGVRHDLLFVSPRSGGAVSRAAASGHERRLLPLPPFLVGAVGAPSLADALAGLTVTGRFVERSLLEGHGARLLPVRRRLIDRLERGIA